MTAPTLTVFEVKGTGKIPPSWKDAIISVIPKEDGKLYDAYVSVGQSAMLSLDGVACFALQILPKELEQKHGYYMYIRGRDDCPGE
ncbi:hypothetical protein GOODEAATRI_015812, partial [Goodea atripinnis]